MKLTAARDDVGGDTAANQAGGKSRIRDGEAVIALLGLGEAVGNLPDEHDHTRGVVDRIHSLGDVTGMCFAAADGTVESMHTLVRDDGLHGCRLTDEAAGGPNAVFLQVTDQTPHAATA